MATNPATGVRRRSWEARSWHPLKAGAHGVEGFYDRVCLVRLQVAGRGLFDVHRLEGRRDFVAGHHGSVVDHQWAQEGETAAGKIQVALAGPRPFLAKESGATLCGARKYGHKQSALLDGEPNAGRVVTAPIELLAVKP